ncbi:SWIM zinc finger family protein [Neobacillus drentensis]|uniref:SWIM zinc finger family protein n=1 Tax=Neobacillus drentensis TaxID=220684 RepID=UPI002FFE14ED
MNLLNFEEWVDEKILKRGLDYFNKGKVISLKTTDGSHFKARVNGSDVYNVEIFLSGDAVLNIYCDCPFNGGYCKHKAACLFALKKGELSSLVESQPTPSNTSKDSLNSLLSNLQKEELISIIQNISDDYPEVEKRLLFQYETSKDEIASSKKLIRDYINGAKRKGFIDWRHVNQALQGAELTLQKAREKLENGDTEGAILLSIAVLSPVVKMLHYSDDSNGSAGTVINWAIQTIDNSVTNGMNHLNEKEQKKLFEVIMKEALKEYLSGWSDWRYDILKICTYFCHQGELRTKLEKQLDALKQQVNHSFDKKEIKLLQLQIIEKCDGESAAERFIYANVNHSEFREKAISYEFNKGNCEKVIQLCLQGEIADQHYRGLVHKWQEFRYKAYEIGGDIENQRKLAKELLLKDNFTYYEKLKGLYSLEEWEPILLELLEEFEKEKYQSSTYLSILKVENLKEQILLYCKNRTSSISDLYPYVIKDYFDDVNDIFITYIQRFAEEVSDRRGYRSVCAVIKTYKKAFGTLHSHKLIKELREKHNRYQHF